MENKIRILTIMILVGIFLFSIGMFVAYAEETRVLKFTWERTDWAQGYKVTIKKYYFKGTPRTKSNSVVVVDDPIDVGDSSLYMVFMDVSDIANVCFTVSAYGVASITNEYVESKNSREICERPWPPEGVHLVR
jgi:Ni,Fe-hydrogenase I cytochrome b subunit